MFDLWIGLQQGLQFPSASNDGVKAPAHDPCHRCFGSGLNIRWARVRGVKGNVSARQQGTNVRKSCGLEACLQLGHLGVQWADSTKQRDVAGHGGLCEG